MVLLARRWLGALALGAALASGALVSDDVMDDEDVMTVLMPGDFKELNKAAGRHLTEAWEAFQLAQGATFSDEVEVHLHSCKTGRMSGDVCKNRLLNAEEQSGEEGKSEGLVPFIEDFFAGVKAERHVSSLGGTEEGDAAANLHDDIFAGALGAPLAQEHFAALPAPGRDDKLAIGGLGDFASAALVDGKEAAAPTHALAVALNEDMQSGALATAGALPLEQAANWTSWALESEVKMRKFRWLFVGGRDHDQWAMMSWALDKNDTLRERAKYNGSVFAEFREWFEAGGGKLSFLAPDHDGDDAVKRPVGLRATEDIMEQDVVLKVPMKLALAQPTLRNVMSDDRNTRLHNIFTEDFRRNEEWGLAYFLAHEHGRGESSPWWPFLRVLHMTTMRSRVMTELKDTFVTRLMRDMDDEIALMQRALDKFKGCSHARNHVCEHVREHAALRWALSVVRRYAVRVKKKTTGKEFLALVPFVHLLPHREGAGGSITLHMDNSLQFTAGEAYEAGSGVFIDRGNFSDAEQLLRFHRVQPETNEHNGVRMVLPGATLEVEHLMWFPDKTRSARWRRMLRLPPKLSTLWQGASKLMIFGDGTDDEEEESFTKVTKEQEKMIDLALEVGAAATRAEAALILTGEEPDEFGSLPAQEIYTALEPEKEGDDIWQGRSELANGFFQLQDAVAAGSVDKSAQRVINQTREFYLEGRMPLRGMDAVDKVMKRRQILLSYCGNATSHIIGERNISTNLMCSLRTHIMNETDVDVLCPAGKPPFADMHCCKDSEPLFEWSPGQCSGETNSIFNYSQPVSRDNEQRVLESLLDSVKLMYALLPGGEAADDKRLLEDRLAADGRETTYASALRYRYREKRLLENTVARIEQRLASLDALEYQVDGVRAIRDREEAEKEQRRARVEAIRNTTVALPVVANLSVNLDGTNVQYLVVREGEAIDDKAALFARKHGIDAAGVATLKEKLLDKAKAVVEGVMLFALPVVDGIGRRRMLIVRDGDDVRETVEDFCIKYNISTYVDDDNEARDFAAMIMAKAEEKHNATVKREVLVQLPVILVDGRSVTLTVREGEQHDLYGVVRSFAEAYGVDLGMIDSIVNAVNDRLPPAVHFQRLTGDAGRIFNLRITSREPREIEATIASFAELYGYPLDIVPRVRQQVMGALHPDADTAPAKPLPELGG